MFAMNENNNMNSYWYALRATYGREEKAYNYIKSKGIKVFYPTINKVRIINGKPKKIEQSRMPNIFFAYAPENVIKSFVYDNVNLPYLRFYYRYSHFKNKEPMIVPDYQIESFRKICEIESNDIIITPDIIEKFKQGEMVRVIEGKFKGVIGVVSRYSGQQRVGIVIEGLLSAATAYIPTAFIEKLDI